MLTAIILVALATIVAAAVAFHTAMTARRGTAVLAFDQALQIAAAAEAVAAYALQDDFNESPQQDHLAERWTQPYGQEVVPGVLLEAQLEDMQGRFNLNNLINGDGTPNERAITEFELLLTFVGIQDATQRANQLVDFIDRDVQPRPDGGEDVLYLSQDPPYRPPNMPIVSTSALLALPGFGASGDYAKIAPYVAALPVGTPINLCTAHPYVLDAMIPGHTQYSSDMETTAQQRQGGCFPTTDTFLSMLGPNDQAALRDRVSERTSYFRLRSYVSIGSAEFALYSLLQRGNGGQVAPILRTWGTE